MALDALSTLLLAVEKGRSDILSEALKECSGGEMDAQRATDRFTALHLSCQLGQVDCVRALLRVGANPVLEDSEGRMPLDACGAVPGRRAKCAEAFAMEAMQRISLGDAAYFGKLLRAGVGPMTRIGMDTLLHWAAFFGQASAAEALLGHEAADREALLAAVNSDGLTPLEVAKQSGHDELLGLLSLAAEPSGPQRAGEDDSAERTERAAASAPAPAQAEAPLARALYFPRAEKTPFRGWQQRYVEQLRAQLSPPPSVATPLALGEGVAVGLMSCLALHYAASARRAFGMEALRALTRRVASVVELVGCSVDRGGEARTPSPGVGEGGGTSKEEKEAGQSGAGALGAVSSICIHCRSAPSEGGASGVEIFGGRIRIWGASLGDVLCAMDGLCQLLLLLCSSEHRLTARLPLQCGEGDRFKLLLPCARLCWPCTDAPPGALVLLQLPPESDAPLREATLESLSQLTRLASASRSCPSSAGAAVVHALVGEVTCCAEAGGAGGLAGTCAQLARAELLGAACGACEQLALQWCPTLLLRVHGGGAALVAERAPLQLRSVMAQALAYTDRRVPAVAVVLRLEHDGGDGCALPHVGEVAALVVAAFEELLGMEQLYALELLHLHCPQLEPPACQALQASLSLSADTELRVTGARTPMACERPVPRILRRLAPLLRAGGDRRTATGWRLLATEMADAHMVAEMLPAAMKRSRSRLAMDSPAIEAAERSPEDPADRDFAVGTLHLTEVLRGDDLSGPRAGQRGPPRAGPGPPPKLDFGAEGHAETVGGAAALCAALAAAVANSKAGLGDSDAPVWAFCSGREKCLRALRVPVRALGIREAELRALMRECRLLRESLQLWASAAQEWLAASSAGRSYSRSLGSLTWLFGIGAAKAPPEAGSVCAAAARAAVERIWVSACRAMVVLTVLRCACRMLLYVAGSGDAPVIDALRALPYNDRTEIANRLLNALDQLSHSAEAGSAGAFLDSDTWIAAEAAATLVKALTANLEGADNIDALAVLRRFA